MTALRHEPHPASRPPMKPDRALASCRDRSVCRGRSRTTLAAAHLGALMEHIVVFEVLAWFVATGLRIVPGGSGAEVLVSTARPDLPHQRPRAEA